MLPTLQGGISGTGGGQGLTPHVNISVTVKAQDDEDKEDQGDDGSIEWAIRPTTPWTSTGHFTIAVLLVFVLSPVIICSNILLLLAFYRFKRLRHPSNYFLVSLASADLGVGLFLPPGLYFEFSRTHVRNPILCLLPYCFFILLCSVSLLSMTAVAVDRCTSLASPLRYNNIITHRSVLRYISIFAIYSLLLSSFPMIAWLSFSSSSFSTCSFSLVLPSVRICLFCVLFAPCAILLIISYGYVYAVARSHARAIFSVELSFRQHTSGSAGSRYGRALAVTVGLFLVLWVPFQVAMLEDDLLQNDRLNFYLGLLALTNAAVDPWVYGYRSTEFRLASLRILHGIAPQLTANFIKPHIRSHGVPGGTSCVSHARLGLTPNHPTGDTMCATLIEIPTAANLFGSGVASAQV